MIFFYTNEDLAQQNRNDAKTQLTYEIMLEFNLDEGHSLIDCHRSKHNDTHV
jgi:hypothetical protein